VRFGLKVNQLGLSWDELVSRARLAEGLGFDSVWIFDHFLVEPPEPCMEAWTLLSALAASTDLIRVGALATGVTWREPAVLAAQAVTVDHVSGGRLDVVLGAGSDPDEHRALGVAFPNARERGELLEEAVRLMCAVMTEDDATFDGPNHHLRGVTYLPRPVQRPHPPIWVAAGGDRLTIPIAARVADGWHCFSPFEELPAKARLFDDLAARQGRDVASIVKAANLSISEPWDRVEERTEALAGLGFGHLVVPWPEAGRGRVEAFASELLPRLATTETR
jgi:alkanesulfonate monooxygenase SsuD/methylene tetrahydromethanopterin reductase-like flavin-dependent oxidoreductase (luciferase family)